MREIPDMDRRKEASSQARDWDSRSRGLIALYPHANGPIRSFLSQSTSDEALETTVAKTDSSLLVSDLASQPKNRAIPSQSMIAAKGKAELALQKARLEEQAAQANLIIEKERAEAAENARQAQIAAQEAERNAERARLRTTSDRDSSLNTLLGINEDRPVELGYGSASQTSSSYRNQDAEREMRRYQQRLSRTMSARGVR